MARRPQVESGSRWQSLLVVVVVTCACLLAYLCVSPLFQSSPALASPALEAHVAESAEVDDGSRCCRGLEHTEFWSDVVKSGYDFLVDTAQQCCEACKAHGRCNSWVYCGDEAKCGNKYRQCWLKRQKDPFDPDIHDTTTTNEWTSGLVFGKDVDAVGLTISSGTMSGGVIHMKLLADCSPKSVLRILEIVKLPHCASCRIYRAEGRGKTWDATGRHVSKMSFGPPYAVIQGSLEPHQLSFKKIGKEYTPAIKRGMVGWIDGGPDFFISLADHPEWPRKHTVFATVVESDMPFVERLAELPTTVSTWEKVAVKVLDKPVDVKVLEVRKH